MVVRLGEKSGRERKYEVFFGGHLRGVATDGARTNGGWGGSLRGFRGVVYPLEDQVKTNNSIDRKVQIFRFLEPDRESLILGAQI